MTLKTEPSKEGSNRYNGNFSFFFSSSFLSCDLKFAKSYQAVKKKKKKRLHKDLDGASWLVPAYMQIYAGITEHYKKKMEQMLQYHRKPERSELSSMNGSKQNGAR